MNSKFHPKFFGLNVRRDGSQPSIFVRSFSPITIYDSNSRRMSKPNNHLDILVAFS